MTKRRRLMWSLLLVPALIYLVILAILFFAQTALIFPAGQVGAAGPLPPGAERLEIAARDGTSLVGLHIPPARPGGERLLVLGFGGNATSADTTAAMLHYLYPEADVVAFHYRGYRPSAGSPSAAALQEDALQVHDAVRARFRPARLIVAGFSVGGGVAAALVARRTVDGLILVTPFDSLAGVAAWHYPWVPVRLLLRHEMEPARDLAGSPTPVALIAGGRDDLVPPVRTQALRLAIANLAFDRAIPEAGHNDIYHHPGFAPAMRAALRELLARGR
jgi:pimeloyl-ACP methyl ester carboxylesterase